MIQNQRRKGEETVTQIDNEMIRVRYDQEREDFHSLLALTDTSD